MSRTACFTSIAKRVEITDFRQRYAMLGFFYESALAQVSGQQPLRHVLVTHRSQEPADCQGADRGMSKVGRCRVRPAMHHSVADFHTRREPVGQNPPGLALQEQASGAGPGPCRPHPCAACRSTAPEATGPFQASGRHHRQRRSTQAGRTPLRPAPRCPAIPPRWWRKDRASRCADRRSRSGSRAPRRCPQPDHGPNGKPRQSRRSASSAPRWASAPRPRPR